MGKILASPADLPHSQYDFIIVGGGTAGCVLANRLSESPDVKVLVIEAGASAAGNVHTVIPFLGVTLAGSDLDWKFETTPQSSLNGRTVPLPRGQVLGGSSVINLMTWNRASNDLWDKWASLTEDEGWSWKEVEKYYKKTSHLVPPADGHDTTGETIPAAHGHGPIEVSVPGYPTELDSRVIQSSKQLGGRFAYNQDLNAGKCLGFSLMQSAVGKGKRSSAATAYLEPALERPNLDILQTTHVTRLIQSGSADGVPEFKMVEVAKGAADQRYQISARHEVILSGGVVGSPHILLLSGIGPKAELQEKGIKPIVDIPDVGKNIFDHPLVANYYRVDSEKTFDALLRDHGLFGKTMQQWQESQQGLFVLSPANTQGYLRIPEDSPIFKKVEDPASGPHSAHTELIFVGGFAPFGPVAPPSEGFYMSILAGVVSPTSRGSITLASSDPFAKPLIDLALLSTEFDIFAIVQAIKDAAEFIKASPWEGFVKGPYGALANATTDEEKAEFARNFSATINHPGGGAAMSPSGAKGGVVDSKLLVKGVAGVRVVDASVFPLLPECHIQSPIYTIAEKAADLIKVKHGIIA
ncbi:aryl-alcohol oxidase-like protein [Hysterangium stoloniferum]|nr:aryl-alcohol oxidase-like protein [Hysterangium stoloniferum]